FLQPSGGPLRTDVIELMRPELRVYLRAALNRAFEHASSTFTPPVPVQFNGVPHRVQLYVSPVEAETSLRTALIIFMEAADADEARASSMALRPEEGESDEVIRLLREELHLANDRLRTTREDAETVNEELRAANEELQSINEEYRSTSEELETSKEELQSI